MSESESKKPPPNTFENANVDNVTTKQPGHDSHLSTHPHHHHHHHPRHPPPDDEFRIKIVNFESKEMECRHCNKQIVSDIRYVTGDTTWSWCICFSLMGCVAGCCLIPFCVNSFKDVVHVCPHCERDLVKYHRRDPTNHRKI